MIRRKSLVVRNFVDKYGKKIANVLHSIEIRRGFSWIYLKKKKKNITKW